MLCVSRPINNDLTHSGVIFIFIFIVHALTLTQPYDFRDNLNNRSPPVSTMGCVRIITIKKLRPKGTCILWILDLKDLMPQETIIY